MGSIEFNRVHKCKSATAKRMRTRKNREYAITAAHQTAFLEAYAQLGVITYAAKKAGIDRIRHYEWMADREKYPDYPARFEDAHQKACDSLESEARRRAVEGWQQPVYQKGELVGEITLYSDRLLELLLKAKRGNEFRERQSVEHTGRDGGPIETSQLVSVQDLNLPEEVLRMIIEARSRAVAKKELPP